MPANGGHDDDLSGVLRYLHGDIGCRFRDFWRRGVLGLSTDPSASILRIENALKMQKCRK